MNKTKVKLVNKGKLTGTGTVCEYLLAEAGWNDLPEDKKFGLMDKHLIVEFPHCIAPGGKPVTYVMFPDEIEKG